MRTLIELQTLEASLIAQQAELEPRLAGITTSLSDAATQLIALEENEQKESSEIKSIASRYDRAVKGAYTDLTENIISSTGRLSPPRGKKNNKSKPAEMQELKSTNGFMGYEDYNNKLTNQDKIHKESMGKVKAHKASIEALEENKSTLTQKKNQAEEILALTKLAIAAETEKTAKEELVSNAHGLLTSHQEGYQIKKAALSGELTRQTDALEAAKREGLEQTMLRDNALATLEGYKTTEGELTEALAAIRTNAHQTINALKDHEKFSQENRRELIAIEVVIQEKLIKSEDINARISTLIKSVEQYQQSNSQEIEKLQRDLEAQKIIIKNINIEIKDLYELIPKKDSAIRNYVKPKKNWWQRFKSWISKRFGWGGRSKISATKENLLEEKSTSIELKNDLIETVTQLSTTVSALETNIRDLENDPEIEAQKSELGSCEAEALIHQESIEAATADKTQIEQRREEINLTIQQLTLARQHHQEEIKATTVEKRELSVVQSGSQQTVNTAEAIILGKSQEQTNHQGKIDTLVRKLEALETNANTTKPALEESLNTAEQSYEAALEAANEAQNQLSSALLDDNTASSTETASASTNRYSIVNNCSSQARSVLSESSAPVPVR